MVCRKYPKEIRHYETVLKKKCLMKFKNNVWESKTKWQLMVRAEYHYRLKLLSLCFYSWLLYIKIIYKERCDRYMAESHYERMLSWKALSALEANVEETWITVKSFKKILEQKLKKRLWDQWRDYLSLTIKLKQMNELGKKIHDQEVILGYIQLWQAQCKEKIQYQIHKQDLEKLYEHKLKQRMMNMWKNYIFYKDHQKKQLKSSVAFYEIRLKHRIFYCMYAYSQIKKTHSKNVNRAQILRERLLLEVYLEKWSARCDARQEERDLKKYEQASSFYRQRILVHTFEGLKKAVEKKIWAETQTQNLLSFSQVLILGKCISKWEMIFQKRLHLKSLENDLIFWHQKETILEYLNLMKKIYEQRTSDRARWFAVVAYYNNLLTHKCFQAWRLRVSLKNEKLMQIQDAELFYSFKLIQACFANWRLFVFAQSKKKMALMHYQKNLLSKVIRRLKGICAVKRIRLKKENLLRKKHETRIKNQIFVAWKNEVRLSQTKFLIAASHARKRQLTLALKGWQRSVTLRISRSCRGNENRLVITKIKIKQAISDWYDLCVYKSYLKEKTVQLNLKQHRRLVRKYFCAWRQYNENNKRLRKYCSEFSDFRDKILLEEYMNKLKRILGERKRTVIQEELAIKQRETLVKRKYLRRWVAFMNWKKGVAQKCLPTTPEIHDLEFDMNTEPSLKSKRKQPWIPSYLREDMSTNRLLNQLKAPRSGRKHSETYKVACPVNKKLPVIE